VCLRRGGDGKPAPRSRLRGCGWSGWLTGRSG
jgi:hypothetical protein